MRHFTAQFALPAVKADPLVFAKPDGVFRRQWSEFLIKQAHPAGINRSMPDLKISKECLKLCVRFDKTHVRLTELGDQFL